MALRPTTALVALFGLLWALPQAASAQAYGNYYSAPVWNGEEHWGTPDGIELGLTASGMAYKEPSVGMELHGITGGWLAAGTMHVDESNWLRLDYRGNMTNRGKYKSASGFRDGEKNTLHDVRLLAGHDIVFGEGGVVAPYLGFGYRRFLNDGRGLTDLGYYGYQRLNELFYAPVGLNIRFGDSFPLELGAEYDFVLQGTQRSDFEEIVPGEGNVENQQTGGRALRAHLGIDPGSGFAYGLYAEQWNMDDSDIALTGSGFPIMEPKNSTREFGFYLKYRFAGE